MSSVNSFAQVKFGAGSANISVYWRIAEASLALFLFFTIIKSGVEFYNRIINAKDGVPPEDSMLAWLKATIFLIVAFATVKGLKVAFNKSLLELSTPWGWAQQILGVLFIIVILLSIIRLYSQASNGDSQETKSAMNRFAFGIIFLMVAFAAVSGYKAIFESGGKDFTKPAYNYEGDFLTAVTSAFEMAVYNSGVVNAFFIGTSSLAIIFLLINVIKKYHGITEGKQIEIWEFAKPFTLMFLIASWKWIYDGLDAGFTDIESLFKQSLNKNGTNDTLELFLKHLSGTGSISILLSTFSEMWLYIIGILSLSLNWIVDTVVTLYIKINLLALVVLAPFAMILAFYDATEGSLLVWFKQFLKFRLFSLVPIMLNYIGIVFLNTLVNNLTGDKASSSTAALNLVGADNVIYIFSFLVFLIMKILFLLVFYNLFTALIDTSGSSVGSTVGGMAKGISSIGKLAAGKVV